MLARSHWVSPQALVLCNSAASIDAPTWHGAHDATADFVEHPRIPIRGRSIPFDVYVLPLGMDAGCKS